MRFLYLVRKTLGLLPVSMKSFPTENRLLSKPTEFSFDEIHFYSINESEETLIGTAIFDSTDDSLNRKIYSPPGDYVGNIILVTE